MSATAEPACQGAAFRIPVTVAVRLGLTRRNLVLGGVALAAVLVAAAPAVAWVSLRATADLEIATRTLGPTTDLRTSVDSGDLAAGRVRLRWSAPAGPPPREWWVERRAVGAGPWAVVVPSDGPRCTAGTCTAVDSHGVAGTSFSYRVRAAQHAWIGPFGHQRLSASLRPVQVGSRADAADLLAAATDGGTGHVRVSTPDAIRHHDGARWAPRSRTAPVDPAVLAAVDGSTVAVATHPGPALPATCAAPALDLVLDVPAGPSPTVPPTAVLRVDLAAAPDTDAVQAVVSANGTGWSAPTGLEFGGPTGFATLPVPTWDSTLPVSLQVCLTARGGSRLQVDSVQVGVQL